MGPSCASLRAMVTNDDLTLVAAHPPGTRPNFYAAGRLDRAARLRGDENWVKAALTDPATRFVPVWRDHNLLQTSEVPRPALLRREALSEALETVTVVLLGRLDGVNYFAVDLSDHEDPRSAADILVDSEFANLRQVGSALGGEEAAMLAYAKGLLFWHARHGFCAACGSPTEVRQAGHERWCPSCERPHFPRMNPAVIMLVTNDDKALMGRSARFPPGMYSTLAGFVEVGESLENAVAREVLEESGISVTDIHYHSSQPWPFPASLMLGFVAKAATTEIDFDPEELVDCQWFSRAKVRELEEARLKIMSRSDSISRRLIFDWLERRGPFHDAP